jgi:hypothetical protein
MRRPLRMCLGLLRTTSRRLRNPPGAQLALSEPFGMPNPARSISAAVAPVQLVQSVRRISRSVTVTENNPPPPHNISMNNDRSRGSLLFPIPRHGEPAAYSLFPIPYSLHFVYPFEPPPPPPCGGRFSTPHVS